MKNPKWHRDEVILALDLYLDENRGTITAKNPKIIALSELMNKLPYHKGKNIDDKFRNPNGVSLKLSNFLALDPAYHGTGMKATSNLDKEVFKEFYNNRVELHRIATLLKSLVVDGNSMAEVARIEEDDNSHNDRVREGDLLYKYHKVRERNRKIVADKKKTILERDKCLRCETCGFVFTEKYGSVGEGFIECHHIVPLSQIDISRETSLDDLILLCSNCHRMIHRSKDITNIPAFISSIRS